MSTTGPAFGGRAFLLVVSATIVFVLMAVLLARLDREMDRVEEAQFHLRLAELRSAVLLMEATLVAKNQRHLAAQYVGSNPLKWLTWNAGDRTAYLGERKLSEVANPEGKWVYDPEQGVVAYMPRSRDWLHGEAARAGTWLQFKVVGLSSMEEDEKKMQGLRLQALQGGVVETYYDLANGARIENRIKQQ